MKFPFNRRTFPLSFFISSQPPIDNKKTEKIAPFAWKVLFILSVISVIILYTETMISIAIPDIIKEFNISYNTSSWILIIYLIVGGIMTPITGKLSDLYGRKKILLLVVTSYTFGVIIGGFSTDIYLLLIARTFQGIGISFIPVAYSIIKDIFPVKRMAIAQSIFTSMFAFGSVLGILLGGSIIQYYGWNMTFYSLIPVTIAIVIVVGRLSHKIERDYKDEIKEKQK
ncbi:MAG: MFS transporter, partial [Nitrososphaeraceae archaeon]